MLFTPWLAAADTASTSVNISEKDTRAPSISAVSVTSISQTSATVSWQTDEKATSIVEFGTDTNLGQSLGDSRNLVTSHSITLSGLSEGTLYYFQVKSQDAAGNNAVDNNGGSYYSFSTSELVRGGSGRSFGQAEEPAEEKQEVPAPDNISPANVQLVDILPSNEQITLLWRNPPDEDFAGVKIQRSQSDFPASAFEGQTVFTGRAAQFTDSGLTNGQIYFYAIFAFDKTGNFSSGTLASAVPKPQVQAPAPPPPAKKGPPKQPPREEPSISHPQEEPLPPAREIKPGQIVTLEKLPESTVKPQERRVIKEFRFDPLQRQIQPEIIPAVEKEVKESQVRYLARMPLKLSLPVHFFPKPVESILVLISGSPTQAYRLTLNEQKGAYEATIVTPPKQGEHLIHFVVNYTDGTRDVLSAKILLDPYGYVYRENLWGEQVRLKGVRVTLYWLNGETRRWEQWPSQEGEQENPQITDETGEYAFLVPKGKYYFRAEKAGYRPVQTPVIEVENEAINRNIQLEPEFSVIKSLGQLREWRWLLGLLVLILVLLLRGSIAGWARFFSKPRFYK